MIRFAISGRHAAKLKLAVVKTTFDKKIIYKHTYDDKLVT